MFGHRIGPEKWGSVMLVRGLRRGFAMMGVAAAGLAVSVPYPSVHAALVPRAEGWALMILGFVAIGVARRVDVHALARLTV